MLDVAALVKNAKHSSGPRRFPTTRWSLVLAARRGTATGLEEALAALCDAYWYPVYAYIRRTGRPAEESRDLTQGFFTRLLEKNDIAAADPARGRFRAFLLIAAKRRPTSITRTSCPSTRWASTTAGTTSR